MILGWVFILTMHFTEMGGGGDIKVVLSATSEDLCKSVRRAIWSQLKDADGTLTKCKLLTEKDQELPKE